MCSNKANLLNKLSEAVLEMEEDEVVEISNEYIKSGYPVIDAIMDGLVDGMNKAGQLFEEEEYFVTDILLCSDAMYQGLNILKPHLPLEDGEKKVKGIIGVVEGDTHDIGKNLVKIMMETEGFEMIDLGRDVPSVKFIEEAKRINASFICLSTLMTTTMDGMKEVVELLKENEIRDDIKVIIGGGPISKKFAESIGADGYSKNAIEAVKLIKNLLNVS